MVIGQPVDVTVKSLHLIGQDNFPTSGNVAMIAMRGVHDALVDNCLLDGQQGTTIDSPTHHYNAGIAFRSTTGDVEVSNCTIRYFGPPNLWATPELPSGDDGGCGCRVERRRGEAPAMLALALLTGLWGTRRQRRAA